MSDLRKNLEHAKQAYGRLQYDGDLADDVFARLDAEQAASLRIDRPAKRAMNWRPILALAAAVAVIATTVVTLTHTGRDPVPDLVATVTPATPSTPTVPVAPTKPATTVDEVAAADFTVVPAYQSFAISVPTSLTLASLDEYDRQAQERGATDASTDTVQ